MKCGRRIGLGLAALLAAAAIWLPLVHLAFGRSDADRARGLRSRQLTLWSDADTRRREADRMRASNPEWDLMARSFLVWSLANHALAEPSSKAQLLPVMDAIIDDTLRDERDEGLYHFLMEYGHHGQWVVGDRSQFLDGELALMLGMRREVEEKEAYRAPLAERTAAMAARMRKSPVLSAESYPDECWTFCNTVALAAMRVEDHLDGTDHAPLMADWVKGAKAKLTDPRTGLLVSSYRVDGYVLDGPEGSSIWMAAHALQIVDAELAADQYARARRELLHGAFGFGWAGEWPASWRGGRDVDSGPVIPLLDVSPGSSGLAFVGAAGFGDRAALARLSATLDFAAFPVERDGGLAYAASNAVGDAVVLYAMEAGPMWRRVGAPLKASRK